tara:strand:- start:87 stop:470 length:384 start_codon:yes stop_codon:yes gene_type:complete
MLRTNSKKYLQNIQKYLLGQIDGTDYKIKTETPLEKINFVFDCFEKEYECEYEKRRTPNKQERFAGWLSGLPSAINLPYTHYSILYLSKELQEVKGGFTKEQEKKICSNYFNFMAYQIIKLKDKIIN